MPKVTDLRIVEDKNNPGSYWAEWNFNSKTRNYSTPTTTVTGIVQVGDLVTISSGATWYNGVEIPDWVMSERWYVGSISGDRAVLNYNEAGDNDICSPISTSYLTGGSGSGSSSSATYADEREVETWTIDHYEVKWQINRGYGSGGWPLWYQSSSEDVEASINNQDPDTGYMLSGTFSPEDGITLFRVIVTPCSKTYTVDSVETYYWSGVANILEWDTEQKSLPDTLGAPSVELKGLQLTATIDVSDSKTDKVLFTLYQVKGDKSTISEWEIKSEVKYATASAVFSVEAGHSYRVSATPIAVNSSFKEIIGKFDGYSEEVQTIPGSPKAFTVCKANSTTEIRLTWPAVTTATSYEIQYATEKKYFDNSDQVSSVTVSNTGADGGSPPTTWLVAGLTTGDEYFFRYRAVNDAGNGPWSSISSCVIGKTPSAPTTWSSTTTAKTGSKLTLFWVHNARDGSSQTSGQVLLSVIFTNGGTTTTKTVTLVKANDVTNEDTKDNTSSIVIDMAKATFDGATAKYTDASGKTDTFTAADFCDGAVIKWKVRTQGVITGYGEYSVERQIDLYSPPTLKISLTDASGSSLAGDGKFTGFPAYLKGVYGPTTQKPLGYYVNITALESYTDNDAYGDEKTIYSGDSVYSKYIDTSNDLMVELSPTNINLANGIHYHISVQSTMSCGLSATDELDFSVKWSENAYEPDAEIGINKENWVAYIRPYCVDAKDNVVTDVTLSVYRRAFDGEYVTIAEDLDGANRSYIVDPHPALDYARYRIVSKQKSTGAIAFYDVPKYPVNCKNLIIQWNDDWTTFMSETSDMLVTPTWKGLRFMIPYNIDISDSISQDVSLVEYTGRSHPVSYYGTQVGQTSSWSFEMPKTDTDGLALIRRLQVYMGDCYVREPSGTGYWAKVEVSYDRNHNELVIPVSLDITRVEGGM